MTKIHLVAISVATFALGLVGGFLLRPTPTAAPVTPQAAMDHSTMTTTMEHTMAGMTAGLQGKTGDEFDKAFLEEMIVHHQGAIDMAELVRATSKRPELLKLADEIITAQTREIDQMRSWQETWFK